MALLLFGMGILQVRGFDLLSASHALTAGAIGTMTLAVMTRAILGHGGHPLKAGTGTTAIYILVCASAFVLFVVLYGPLCLGGRPGDR